MLGGSPDDLTALNQATVQANAGLMAPKSVSYSAFYIQNYSDNAPKLEQVVAAWLNQVSLTGAVNDGARTTTQLNADLNAFNAKPMIAAAQKVVFQQSYKAARVRVGNTWYELLHFPTAARLVVITLSGN